MPVTSTQNSGNGVYRIATGRYVDTGTAAAFTLTIGFKPRYVHVVNNTSGDEIEWFEGMADASGFKKVAAGTTAQVTTLGITPLSYGFTVGLDTDINVTSEQLSWVAIG